MISRAWRRLESRHRAWRYRVRVDPHEISWLRAALQPGDVAVDAGAYKGGYTYWMRDAVGEAGHIYAFEPQPEPARFLEQRVAAFSWSNVRVEAVALSSGERMAVLGVPGMGPSRLASLEKGGESARGIEVPCRTLDDFFTRESNARAVRLIKCDVEGHELDVFRGAATVLKRDRPLLLFECEAKHLVTHTVDDVFEHLASQGYRGWFFDGKRRRDVGDFSVDRDQVPGKRPYINNFIFEPARPA